MAAINDLDWEVTRSTGAIRYTGYDHDGNALGNTNTTGGARPAAYHTVIELHRWLQDKADDASSSGDDELDITDSNPSERSTDNIIRLLGSYNIDDQSAEFLYDGSIIQGTGGTEVFYDGFVNFGNPEVEIGAIQNGTVISDDFWNLGGHHGTATGGSTSTLVETGAGWTADEWVGYVVRIPAKGAQGLITANTTDTLTVADLFYGSATSNAAANTDVFYIAKGINADPAAGISHRAMLKTRTAGADIDGRRVVGFARTFNKTYSEFTINGTSRGNNVFAISDADDLNNDTAPNSLYDATTTSYVAPFTNVSVTEGYANLDVNNDGADENFYTTWDRGSGTKVTINQLYEYTKYQSRYKSELTTPLHGIAGDLFRGVTHQIEGGGTGTELFVQNETLSWGSGATAGTGILLAVDNDQDGLTSKIWIQLLTGIAPAAASVAVTGATNGASITTSGAAIARTLNYPFIGQSTGSALIGAYGVGVDTTDLTNADLLRALDNVTYQPPNNVTFTVGGLVDEEDYVLVAPSTGAGSTTILTNQMSLVGNLTSATTTSITVNGIPADTPSSGTIRVFNDAGFQVRVPYSSYTGSTFTVTSTDFSTTNATSGNNAYVSYIDELVDTAAAAGTADVSASFTTVYSSDLPLVVKVRDGGPSPIKEFITASTLGDAGGSVTAIRTSDA